MSLVKSVDIPLGTKLPEFELSDPFGEKFKSLDMLGSKELLLVVTCNHCPYAIAIWPRVVKLARHALSVGIHTVAINPNIHPSYPEDSPQEMRERISEWGVVFPYLIDESQDVAKTLKAQCTPDIYLYDAAQKLVYHGRIDDNWKDESRVIHHELRQAIDNLVMGRLIDPRQHPSMGCSIKWT